MTITLMLEVVVVLTLGMEEVRAVLVVLPTVMRLEEVEVLPDTATTAELVDLMA